MTRKKAPDKAGTADTEDSLEQSMILKRIEALQEQRHREMQENYTQPEWVEGNVKEGKSSLRKLVASLSEDQQKEVVKTFTVTSDIAVSLSKKVSTALSENTLLNTKLSKYQELCKRLQQERSLLRKKFEDMETRDKKWRADLESQFDTSIKDIKDQISRQEGQNANILAQNEALTKQVEILQKQNTLLTETLELRETDKQKMETDLSALLKAAAKERDMLKEHLTSSLDINKEYSSRLVEYKDKYEELQSTIQKSNEIISILKKSKDKLMSTNKLLTKRNDEYLKKAKLWQTKVTKVTEEKERVDKQKKAMANLCHTLKEKNRELRGELALEKARRQDSTRMKKTYDELPRDVEKEASSEK